MGTCYPTKVKSKERVKSFNKVEDKGQTRDLIKNAFYLRGFQEHLQFKNNYCMTVDVKTRI